MGLSNYFYTALKLLDGNVPRAMPCEPDGHLHINSHFSSAQFVHGVWIG